MGKINWRRVVLCGLLTGVVWGVLYAIVFRLVSQDFLAAVRGCQGIAALPRGGYHIPGTSAGLRGILLISPLVMGISTMWLYAAIRPRYGPGPKTAALAGFALWFIGSWVDATWAALGVVPIGTLVGPVAVNLPIALMAVIAGAWPYKD